MRIDIITCVPSLLASPLDHSILGRAQTNRIIEIHVHDLRDHADGRQRQVDDYPYGGGAGMVLKPEPVYRCLETLPSSESKQTIYLSPDGEQLDQEMANELSLQDHLVLIAGHYKGIDQRIRDTVVDREISIGDYVLSGGELPALVLVDAVVRLIPGVLGDATSALSDSFQDQLLDAPSYTRPREFRGLAVPDVLLSGDHERISEWREEERIRKTRSRRPDLLDGNDPGRD